MLSAIEIGPCALWQKMIKRSFDVLVSLCSLIVLSPMFLYVAIRVYMSSPGPILYLQQRVGLRRKNFWLLKFRSMYVDAESSGPRLAANDDTRITPWGRKMRRWRLDELPQLINVLVGDMSIVGTRPERAFYIEQLEKAHLHFDYLLETKPGLTSLGMIKFGYAANVEQMAERMKYDLLYIEKQSFSLDLRIIFHTFKVVLAGKGK